MCTQYVTILYVYLNMVIKTSDNKVVITRATMPKMWLDKHNKIPIANIFEFVPTSTIFIPHSF